MRIYRSKHAAIIKNIFPMKKYLLLNTVWLALALGAFLLGRSTSGDVAGSDQPLIRKSTGKSSISRSGSLATTTGSTGNSNRISRGGGQDGARVTIGQFLNERDPLLANRMFAELILSMDASSAGGIFEELKNRKNLCYCGHNYVLAIYIVRNSVICFWTSKYIL